MFKIGDKIKCIKSTDFYGFENVFAGRIYTVKSVGLSKKEIQLLEIRGSDLNKTFETERFELAATAESQQNAYPIIQETVAQSASVTVKSIIQSMEANGVPNKLSVKIDNYVITIRKN